MNNSDYNDFNNWQNGDENEMNNPNNWFPKNGFFYYGSSSDAFKKMWENINNGENPIEYMKEYFHMDDITKKYNKNNKRPKPSRPTANKMVVFSQEDYLKLIEIRGYLNITEQYAHVKALDKLINQIQILPKGGNP
jgi:hypothetical protein